MQTLETVVLFKAFPMVALSKQNHCSGGSQLIKCTEPPACWEHAVPNQRRFPLQQENPGAAEQKALTEREKNWQDAEASPHAIFSKNRFDERGQAAEERSPARFAQAARSRGRANPNAAPQPQPRAVHGARTRTAEREGIQHRAAVCRCSVGFTRD